MRAYIQACITSCFNCAPHRLFPHDQDKLYVAQNFYKQPKDLLFVTTWLIAALSTVCHYMHSTLELNCAHPDPQALDLVLTPLQHHRTHRHLVQTIKSRKASDRFGMCHGLLLCYCHHTAARTHTRPGRTIISILCWWRAKATSRTNARYTSDPVHRSGCVVCTALWLITWMPTAAGVDRGGAREGPTNKCWARWHERAVLWGLSVPQVVNKL